MKIKISESAARDFLRIAALGREALEKIAADLNTTSAKCVLRRDKFVQLLEKHVGSEEASRLEHHAFAMAHGSDERGLTPVELLDALTPSIGEFDWTAENLESWNKIKPAYASLLDSAGLRCLQKSLALSYEHDRLLTSAKVITDIRPVFDDPQENIIASVITQTLRLEYYEGGNEFEFSVAVDVDDLKELTAICTKALNKAQKARNLMSKSAKVETVYVGEGG